MWRCGTPCACCAAPQVLAWQLTEQEEQEGWAWPCSLQEARRLPQARQVDPSMSYEEQGMCKVGPCTAAAVCQVMAALNILGPKWCQHVRGGPLAGLKQASCSWQSVGMQAN